MSKKKKFFIIFPYLVLAIIIFLVADYFWKVSGTEKTFHLEEIKSIDFNEKKNNACISMNPINVINQAADEINFTIWSDRELKTFRLLDFEILFEGYKIKLKRDILYELKTDNPNFFKIINKNDSNNNLIYQYLIFGGYENYKTCKINFKKVFAKKRMNFGDKVPVKIIIHYFLDDNEYSQELNFVCECIESDSYPPSWFMFFFPGAY